ncbi:MAG: hypothetical protein R3B72_36120 [Polyangiaceae bacterium]
MELESSLQAMTEAFERRDEAAFSSAMQEVYARASSQAVGGRAAASEALLRSMVAAPPALGASFAIIVGALVEQGLESEPLAERLGAPLLEALVQARPMVAALAEAEPAGDDDEDAIWLGQNAYTTATVAALAEQMPQASSALRSLDTWFRPAVASLTRAPGVLARLQDDPELRGAIGALAPVSLGAHWLAQLIDSVVSEPFAFLLPEIDRGVAMTLEGVSDCGQLMVLLSEAMREPLAALGATVPAGDEILAVMRGDGPQQGSETYGADFHLYPWRAYDPTTRRPENGRFTWSAPGGVGSHSLPADFQPRTIEPLDGRRVLLVRGPSEGLWTRVISAARTFEPLRAAIRDVEPIDENHRRAWYRAIETALDA